MIKKIYVIIFSIIICGGIMFFSYAADTAADKKAGTVVGVEITKEAAEPKRLSTDGQRQELRKKKEAVKQLPTDEDIDKMNTQEIKEVLKIIVSIIKTR
ncbi:MAG: hypothetical protein L3V56_02310 [Candidatus Magnetoovum sp. WYHC-5]|nr:hypothetical protein [Candidatus Magnetoovum sp. WYHC-5]